MRIVDPPQKLSATMSNLARSSYQPLIRNRLQCGFYTNTMAHFAEKVSSDVADFIVANRWESSMMAVHSMLNTKLFSAHNEMEGVKDASRNVNIEHP